MNKKKDTSITLSEINVREKRLDNQEWAIQRHWQTLRAQDTGRRQTKQ